MQMITADENMKKRWKLPNQEIYFKPYEADDGFKFTDKWDRTQKMSKIHIWPPP